MRLSKFNEYYQGDLSEIDKICLMLTDEGCEVNIEEIGHRDFSHHLKIDASSMNPVEFVMQCKSVREHLKNACSVSEFMIINHKYKYINIDGIDNPKVFAGKNGVRLKSAVCFFKI